MNKKNLIKIFSISFIVLFGLLLFVHTTCYAKAFNDGKSTTYMPAEFTKDEDNKTEGGEIVTTGDGISNVKTVGGEIVGLIRVIGTIVSVGMLIVLGIKYMMGSAEEKAEYKKTLFPYFVGAVLIFAATSLAQIIYNWAITI